MEITGVSTDQTRSHWWWRPGWGPGRRKVTFHLTFGPAAGLRAEAERLGTALADLPDVDPVPPDWLHLTMTDVGILTDLAPGPLAELGTAVLDRVTEAPLRPLLLESLYVSDEGVMYNVRPDPWLHELQGIQAQAVRERFDGPGGQPGAFHAHISLAYFRGPVDTDLVMSTLRAAGPAQVRIPQVDHSLIALSRDAEQYVWQRLDHRRLVLDGAG